MILRRITQAFRRQNWFTVFVETMIVVAGVFIGIQVANWNDAQQSKVQVADLMTRMVSDATTTRREMARYKEFHQEIYENAFQRTLALKDKKTCIATETGSIAHIQSANVRTGIQTITDEMEFIDRQWQRYVSMKQNALAIRVNPEASKYVYAAIAALTNETEAKN